ncbi:MAG: hypothetical protein R3Y35_13870 [Clostridia bacterium]
MRNNIVLFKLISSFLKFCIEKLIERTKFVLKDTKALSVAPKDLVESLARSFYPLVVEFFENEENQKAYEEWKKNRELKKASSTN